MKNYFSLIALCCLVVACNRKSDDARVTVDSAAMAGEVMERIPEAFPYNIAQPDTVYKLAEDLDEISGLQWWGEDNLLAIADEVGVVYVLNAASGRIRFNNEFEEKGDFEGICLKGEDVFALRSDGDIFRIPGFSKERAGKTTRIKTGLDYDCEGLFYHAATSKFLIACKDTVKHGERAIFTTGLEADEKPEMAYTVAVEGIEDSLITNSFDKVAYTIANALSTNDHAGILGPSGLSINPRDNKIYLLSGTSSLLVILSAEGKFETAIPLPIDILPQPEGITFSPSGDLYIASEKAQKQHGVIAKFSYRK